MKKSIEKKGNRESYKAVVIGGSLGAMSGIKTILSGLPVSFGLTVVIVTHVSATSDNAWIQQDDLKIVVPLKEARIRERLLTGTVYVSPANYHLLINSDHTFGLDVGELVNYARPSIDVLFESAADAYGPQLIGLLLSGNGQDGVQGLQRVQEKEGLTIVQNPKEAEAPSIPQSAIERFNVDHVWSLEQITNFLRRLH